MLTGLCPSLFLIATFSPTLSWLASLLLDDFHDLRSQTCVLHKVKSQASLTKTLPKGYSLAPHSALPLFLLISLLFCHLSPPPSPSLRPSRPLLILVPSGSSDFTEPSHFLLHHRPDQSVPSIRSCHAEITQNHSEIKSRNPSNWKKRSGLPPISISTSVGSPSDHWKTIKRIRSKYQPRTQTVGTRVTVLLRSEKSTVLAHHLRDHVWPIPLPDPVEDPLSPQPDLESPFTMVDMFRSGREGA